MPIGLLYVSERVKTAIAEKNFNSVESTPVKVTKAVKIGWRSWDRSKEEPKIYPAGSEPENYILGRKHNEEVARQIPRMWALQGVEIDGSVTEWTAAWKDGEANAPDLASHLGGFGYYASLRFSSFLETITPSSVSFL